MNFADEQNFFRVESERDGFKVVDAEGKILVACGDRVNAEQYAVLLNESYRRGFRDGFRQGRRAK